MRAVISLESGWRFPLGVFTLCLPWQSASTSQQENADGQVYRTGRTRVKLHARGDGPERQATGSHVVETNAASLIEVLKTIPRPRHLCLEEGILAGWLYEVLSPHVDEIVVAAVRESRGPKSDTRDAFARAEELRIGALTRRVYKERGQFAALGHRAKAHWLLVGDSVR